MHAYIDTKRQGFDLQLHHHFDSLHPVADVPIDQGLHCLANVFMKCSQNYRFATQKVPHSELGETCTLPHTLKCTQLVLLLNI